MSYLLPLLFLVQLVFSGNTESFILNQIDHSKKTTKIKQDDFVLKIKREVLTEEQLTKWFDDQYFIYSSEVKKFRTPYRGAISKNVTCESKLAPERVELEQNEVIGAFVYRTDKRYLQNTCLNKNVQHLSALLVVLCENQSFKVKVHLHKKFGKEKLLKFIKEIRCGE